MCMCVCWAAFCLLCGAAWCGCGGVCGLCLRLSTSFLNGSSRLLCPSICSRCSCSPLCVPFLFYVLSCAFHGACTCRCSCVCPGGGGCRCCSGGAAPLIVPVVPHIPQHPPCGVSLLCGGVWRCGPVLPCDGVVPLVLFFLLSLLSSVLLSLRAAVRWLRVCVGGGGGGGVVLPPLPSNLCPPLTCGRGGVAPRRAPTHLVTAAVRVYVLQWCWSCCCCHHCQRCHHSHSSSCFCTTFVVFLFSVLSLFFSLPLCH